MNVVRHMVSKMLKKSVKSTADSSVNWHPINTVDELNELIAGTLFESAPVLILFKHSTRCSISAMAKHRIEANWNWSEEEVVAGYIDVISSRSVSNEIEKWSGVRHESPQLIVIKNGQITTQASHGSINVQLIDA